MAKIKDLLGRLIVIPNWEDSKEIYWIRCRTTDNTNAKGFMYLQRLKPIIEPDGSAHQVGAPHSLQCINTNLKKQIFILLPETDRVLYKLKYPEVPL